MENIIEGKRALNLLNAPRNDHSNHASQWQPPEWLGLRFFDLCKDSKSFYSLQVINFLA